MKKVLLISYFYPPANFAGSYRVEAWATYLQKAGYKPIVVTRHWDNNCTDYTAISKETNIVKSKQNGITIYKVPYNGTYRDRLVNKSKNLASFGKVLSFFNLVLSLYWLKLNPAYGLLEKAREILLEDNDIEIVITSGRPFYQFQFLYQLKKEFPSIKCYGDYRDPWNTNTNINSSLKRKFFRLLETPIEKKTTDSFEALITCSEGFRENIQHLIKNKKIEVITNGFKDFVNKPHDRKNNKFEIAYIGSLYDNQAIEKFISPLISNNKSKHFKLIFYGLNNQENQETRVLNLIKGSEFEVIIKPWMEKEQMISEVSSQNALLLCGIPERKGTYTAKFFDYLSLQKNIILCPSDDDILEKEIERLNIGVVLNSEKMVLDWVQKLSAINFEWKYEGKKELIAEFSYQNQVNKLIKLIEE